MKRIFVFFIYIFVFIIFFIFYELTSIDRKYINRSVIDIDVNNVRNPQIKKLVRAIDNFLGNFYFNSSKKKQNEFYDKDLEKYNNLPDEIIIKAELDNLTISNERNFNNSINWTRSHGNHSSNKFSNLKKINTKNVKNLEVAWTHTFGKKWDIPGNPIYLDGNIYLSSTDKSLVALNASNGKKIWEYKTEVSTIDTC